MGIEASQLLRLASRRRLGYDGGVKGASQQNLEQLRAKIAEQEASLATYKQTLREIYALYDARVEELSLVRRLSDSLRMDLNLKKVCLAVVEAVMDELAPDGSLLLLIGPKGRLRLKASAKGGQEAVYWPDRHSVQALAVEAEAGAIGQAARSGRPVLLPKLEHGTGLLAGASSLVCLPLIAREETIGVFGLVGQAEGAFSEDDVRILTIICDQAAAALYNVRLFNEVKRVNRVLRRSEREARLARERLERLLESANDLIITLDRQGRITYVNSRVSQLGFEPAALAGRPFSELIDAEEPDPRLTELAEAGAVQELPFKDAQGHPRTVLVSFTPLPPAEEDEPALLVIARDVTERKQLERQLMHSEKLASVGLLAAGVAHEIGNPLSAISGYAQILKKTGLSAQESAEYVTAIEEQAGRIERIIQDLLTYSRPSRGVRSRIKVNEALSSILFMLTNQKLFRGLEVVPILDPADPEVFMDRDLLAQVVINLVVNAAQALENHKGERPGRITITTRALADKVSLIVADNGPGVAPQDAQRIFDPFFTTKAVGHGTGLGLAICHRIVEGEGGAIRLLEGEGPGAAFEVLLNRAEEEAG